MLPLEFTATLSTSPKFMSGVIFRKSVEESNGMSGTARLSPACCPRATTAVSASVAASAVRNV